MIKLIILIPAYNEEASIGNVVRGLPKTLDGVDSIECLVVNDGSTDATEEVAKQSGAQVFSHSHNKAFPSFKG